MHLYFIVRGVLHQLELFKMFMQTQMFVWRRKNQKLCKCGQKKEEHKKTKECKKFNPKIEYGRVQGALRDMGFCYEYVFPEECLDEVLTMLNTRNSDIKNFGWIRPAVLRKMLGKGVKPIPEYKDVVNQIIMVDDNLIIATARYIEMQGIAFYPIGIKKDLREKHDWGPEGHYEQEML